MMGTAVGIGLSVLGGVADYNSQMNNYRAQKEANEQTYRNIIKSMNYSLMNQEQERRDAYEAVIDEMTNIKLQGGRLESSVNAAVNENMQGRTADMIKRSAANDTARALGTAKSNYAMKSNEIDLNKETTVFNASQQISGIRAPEKPSAFATLLKIGSGVFDTLTASEQISAMKNKAGIGGTSGSSTKYNFNVDPWERYYSFNVDPWERYFK